VCGGERMSGESGGHLAGGVGTAYV
jgi:hypothetical protein